jgi:outer membrane protein OmpA-like peptidoglycan-associated protein
MEVTRQRERRGQNAETQVSNGNENVRRRRVTLRADLTIGERAWPRLCITVNHRKTLTSSRSAGFSRALVGGGRFMKSQLTGGAIIVWLAVVLGGCAYDPHFGRRYDHSYGIEYQQRSGFGEDVDVERDGDKINLHILGDVLFPLDSARLRPRARGLISSIAAELMQYSFSAVEVRGFTDTSGTFEHNQLLSEERANAVADELARNGVDWRHIRARGFGEAQLAVPTPNGVRERQNRRVEIMLAP